jgi:L-ascorbate metabolism protein UlaG (beta-lactamase superfamily)
VGLDPWETTSLVGAGRPNIDITATPCRHGPPLSHPIVGDVVGFALHWDGQDHGVLWVSGDTVLYDGLRQVGDRLDVDVAILHLGGARFTVSGPIRYTMTIADAITLCRELSPRVVVPVHYEGWSHFREGGEAIEAALEHAPAELAERFRLLPLGEPTSLSS